MMKNNIIKNMKRLTTTNPTHIKLQKLFNYMRELDLEIEYLGGSFRVTDNEFPENLSVQNLTVAGEENESLQVLPPQFDNVKFIVYEGI